MAWTTPRTWVTAETVTAALMNAHVRDNLRETSPFTVTTAGDLSYADAANSMNSRLAIGADGTFLASTGTAPVWRVPATDVDAGTGTLVDTTFTSLATITGGTPFAGEISVAVTTGTSALVFWKARLANSTAGTFTWLSYSISGATTSAAIDSRSINFESSAANDLAEFGGFRLQQSLTAGSNTFTLAARVTSGTGTITRPEICVIPL